MGLLFWIIGFKVQLHDVWSIKSYLRLSRRVIFLCLIARSRINRGRCGLLGQGLRICLGLSYLFWDRWEMICEAFPSCKISLRITVFFLLDFCYPKDFSAVCGISRSFFYSCSSIPLWIVTARDEVCSFPFIFESISIEHHWILNKGNCTLCLALLELGPLFVPFVMHGD
jgi:hypothetical protein